MRKKICGILKTHPAKVTRYYLIFSELRRDGIEWWEQHFAEHKNDADELRSDDDHSECFLQSDRFPKLKEFDENYQSNQSIVDSGINLHHKMKSCSKKKNQNHKFQSQNPSELAATLVTKLSPHFAPLFSFTPDYGNIAPPIRGQGHALSFCYRCVGRCADRRADLFHVSLNDRRCEDKFIRMLSRQSLSCLWRVSLWSLTRVRCTHKRSSRETVEPTSALDTT